MEYKEINMKEYPRAQHFEYFKNLAYPYVGLTANVEITDWLKEMKKREYPFFASFLYEVTRAANGVPQLRQRIRNHSIIEYDNCLSSYTVALPDETFCYCRVECTLPMDEFIVYAKKEQEAAMNEASIADDENVQSLFFISSVPWLSYTNIIQPVPIPGDSNPRISWGKYFEENGKVFIPVSILCHHALVDGIHISKFYRNLQKQLEVYMSKTVLVE